MQITPIQQYRTQNIQPKAGLAKSDIGFQGLHVSKCTLKRLGVTREKLLQNKSIKDCADRAEVFIKSKNKLNSSNLKKEISLGGFTGLSFGVAAATFSAMLHAVGAIESLKFALGVSAGIGISMPILFGGAYLLSNIISPLKNTARMQASDGVKNGKPTGRKTKVYEMDSKYLSDKYKNFKLSEELLKLGNQDFRKITYKYRDRNFGDTKTFLDILNEDKVKTDFKNGDIFNYKLNEQGDTLLTRFFDIVPNETNEKEYRQIIDRMKNMHGIIYNQKDSYGISVLEKILNSENPQGLELVQNYKFPYMEEIDWVYNNIADEDFKNKARNLKIDFESNIGEIFGYAPYNENLLSKILSSPFLDKDEYSKQVLEFAKKNFSKSYTTETIYPALMKYGMLPTEIIDDRIKELEVNLEQNAVNNDSGYGYYL